MTIVVRVSLTPEQRDFLSTLSLADLNALAGLLARLQSRQRLPTGPDVDYRAATIDLDLLLAGVRSMSPRRRRRLEAEAEADLWTTPPPILTETNRQAGLEYEATLGPLPTAVSTSERIVPDRSARALDRHRSIADRVEKLKRILHQDTSP